MKIKSDNAGSSFNYLSVKGSAITFDTNVVGPGNPITGPITASAYTDRGSSKDSRELALNFTIAAVAGTMPSLEISFLVLDPMEPSNGVTGIPPTPLPPPLIELPLTKQPINSSVNIRFVIANGNAVVWYGKDQEDLGSMNVPMLWQVYLRVAGTSPSFSLIATYEQRA